MALHPLSQTTMPGLPGLAAGCRMMALLELPALRDFAPSDASATRLHELLHSRFKIEVRGAAQRLEWTSLKKGLEPHFLLQMISRACGCPKQKLAFS